GEGGLGARGRPPRTGPGRPGGDPGAIPQQPEGLPGEAGRRPGGLSPPLRAWAVRPAREGLVPPCRGGAAPGRQHDGPLTPEGRGPSTGPPAAGPSRDLPRPDRPRPGPLPDLDPARPVTGERGRPRCGRPEDGVELRPDAGRGWG